MNLNFTLSEQNFAAARQVIGEEIDYCVPADLSLDGRRVEGYLAIGSGRWAHVRDGQVRDHGNIADACDYHLVPFVGNAVLEATENGTKRIIVRVTMQHASRYGYITQILNDMAANRPVRIYRDEGDPVCAECGSALVPGTRVCPRCMSKAAAFKRLLLISKRHWRCLMLGLGVLIAASALAMTGPYFQKLLVNAALLPPAGQEASVRVFWLALLGMLFTLAFGELLGIARNRIMASVSTGIAADLRKTVFDRIQSMSLGFLTSQRAGDLMNRVTADTDRIRHLIQEMCTTAIHQLLILIASATLLFSADWRLALIVLLPAPFVGYLHYYIWRHVLNRLFHKQWRISDKANSFLHDVLSGIRVVKAFGQEEREIRRFRTYNGEFAAAALKSEKLYSILSPISNYLIQIGQYLVLLIGCYMIIGREMNVGELIQFSAYAAMIFGPISWLMFMPRWIANAVISMHRVFSVIDEQPEVMDANNAVGHRIRGLIEFRDVFFGYRSYEPVLKEINLTVKPGEMIGLVGHSGSGKSTTINLISRFYDANEGEIRIDGIDIRKIQQEDLRSQIGVVLQETFLFSGTIAENIQYSKPGAKPEEVIEAAKIANAHDFIISLPDGYDTRLEENGNNLSGGERQRIAIARAVLNDPRILILDEATASLDIETEAAIQEALKRVTKNRTTIAIAHRLSTLRNADRLVVLDKGRIAEIGTHRELMKKQGIYYNLISAQRGMSRKSDPSAVV
ncbi:ABC transporter ATP-binding protein [Paenibacillus sp. FSL W7-1332]|uniref:ABC transporter ATP-binding protein n=1 Tax=Paenibacillus sp. FSL W7-1332 TaxID=2921702 RepID=UPI0030CC01B8